MCMVSEREGLQMNGADLVASTTDPAFTTDGEGVIRAWNAAAEEEFGVTATEARGSECARVLRGRDPYGNEYCSVSCPLRQMALQGRAVHRCELHFRNDAGQHRPYSVSTLLLSTAGEADPEIVHLLQPVYSEVKRPRWKKRGFSANHERGELSPREREVLRLLADGRPTDEIARTLFISHSTARNHIQHILHKLHAHSRLEAVAAARRAALI